MSFNLIVVFSIIFHVKFITILNIKVYYKYRSMSLGLYNNMETMNSY
jgi:hypothetical protein